VIPQEPDTLDDEKGDGLLADLAAFDP